MRKENIEHRLFEEFSDAAPNKLDDLLAAVDDIPQPRLATPEIYVRAVVKSSGICNDIKSTAQFYYSFDGKKFQKIGEPYTVKEGKWIGAKVGFFNCRSTVSNDAAFLDIDWIRFEK